MQDYFEGISTEDVKILDAAMLIALSGMIKLTAAVNQLGNSIKGFENIKGP